MLLPSHDVFNDCRPKRRPVAARSDGSGSADVLCCHFAAIVFDEHVSEDMAMIETPDVLSADEFRSFTISWAEGHIKVYVKGDPSPIMEWRDPDPIEVRSQKNIVPKTTHLI